MTSDESRLLVETWIAHCHAADESKESGETFWAMSRVIDMAMDEPAACWQFILDVLDRDFADEVQELLAAGPMESLLSWHGAAYIDCVEEEASRNAKLRSLLGGVWQCSMPDEIWARVCAIADRSGWD